MTFRDATGSRPFGWIGRPPGGFTPFNNNVSKVSVSEVNLGPLEMVSSVYSLLKFQPRCWQLMSVLKFLQLGAKKLLKEMITEVVPCPSFESDRLITWGRTWQLGSETAYCRYYNISKAKIIIIDHGISNKWECLLMKQQQLKTRLIFVGIGMGFTGI